MQHCNPVSAKLCLEPKSKLELMSMSTESVKLGIRHFVLQCHVRLSDYSSSTRVSDNPSICLVVSAVQVLIDLYQALIMFCCI